MKELRPQKGYQEKVLSTSADICISGASAGVGKTFALLLEFLRHVNNKKWGGVIFRRTTPQIKNEGGLWDASSNIYPYVGGTPKESVNEWHFQSGAKLKFSHLEYEKDKLNWMGSELNFIGFDELTHFSSSQFFYLLSRNRSTSGIQPYVRATCNPDPDSWVYELIKWWIGEDGYPIKERDGVIRYFIRHEGKYIWGNTKEEVISKSSFMLDEMVEKSEGTVKAEDFIKSITFISGSIYDNKELLRVNPQYLANLNAQDDEVKAQLLDGNWKIRIDNRDIYDYHAFLDVFTNDHLPFGKPYITADIAMEGSDKLVIWVWRGFVVVDVEVIDKSDGKEVIDILKRLKTKHGVPERNISYDNDGVGRYIKGFFPNAIAFLNGGVPVKRENYANLKTQCYYKSGKRVKENGIYILPEVAEKQYSKGVTIKQRLLQERKAIKKIADRDGKLQINKKEEQKVLNNGESPDLTDALMMREIFALKSSGITVRVT
ncbi:hypothetical protein EP331_00430 [bacterium]|nr:MAG: hypothetical protein EP331_00430 [bacterium]